MIGTIISHNEILETSEEGGRGVFYKPRGLAINYAELSPKGIDRSTEGSALGSHLLRTVTTLKGLNT